MKTCHLFGSKHNPYAPDETGKKQRLRRDLPPIPENFWVGVPPATDEEREWMVENSGLMITAAMRIFPEVPKCDLWTWAVFPTLRSLRLWKGNGGASKTTYVFNNVWQQLRGYRNRGYFVSRRKDSANKKRAVVIALCGSDLSEIVPEPGMCDDRHMDRTLELIRVGVEHLPARTRDILTAYCCDDDQTFQSVAESAGITRERVRQVVAWGQGFLSRWAELPSRSDTYRATAKECYTKGRVAAQKKLTRLHDRKEPKGDAA
jgi:hypothetical protein